MAITGNVPPVTMLPVQSSNLAEIGFRCEDHAAHTGTLFVRFHPKKGMPAGAGDLWGYRPVPGHLYEALRAAESKGKFFIQFIRDAVNGEGGKLYQATHW